MIFAAGGTFFTILLAVALATAAALVLALILVRDRPLVLMVAVVATITLPVHKLFGPFYETTYSGAPGLVLSSTMIVLGLLYVVWMAGGTFGREVLRALRRPAFWIPLVAMLLTLPSVASARNDFLVFAQFVFMTFIYLLFLAIGARVRTRRQVVVLLVTFGVIAVFEAGVVVLQKAGLLNLALLTSEATTESLSRATDTETIGRPFGTLIHPVFLGITMAMIAVVMFSLALYLQRTWIRLMCLGVVVVCLAQILLAFARGPLIGVAPTLLVLLIIGAAHHRVSARAWVTGILAVAIALIALSPLLMSFYDANFGSKRVSLEVDSRTQLNDVGWRMIDASPLVGLGLNNYTQMLADYIEEPLIFAGYPAHNLFILTTAETGLVGLAGLLAVGVALAWNAIGLLRSRDPLFRAMGSSMLGILLLNLIAEQLSYSMRQEVPLLTFWIFAGLTMACVRIREDEARARGASAGAVSREPTTEGSPALVGAGA
ncbi:MAG: O-antigen ligase family protein [Acidimicrobiales bacterium]